MRSDDEDDEEEYEEEHDEDEARLVHGHTIVREADRSRTMG